MRTLCSHNTNRMAGRLVAGCRLALELSGPACPDTGAAAVLERQPHLDVLLLNAGVLHQTFRRTPDGNEAMYQTNYLGHFLLAHLLLPALLRAPAGAGNARVVAVSSELHKYLGSGVQAKADFFEKLQPTDPYPYTPLYGLTKLYGLWFTYRLAELLRGTNVTANAVTPGFVPTTNMSREASWLGQWAMRHLASWLPFAVPLREGGRRLAAACAGEAEGAARGAYFSGGRQKDSSAASRDATEGERLWELSMRAVGIDKYI